MASSREPIAIIGSGCRFPGSCDTPSKLWELLRQPRDLLRQIPETRFDAKAFYHPDPTHHGTTDVQKSYFLDEDPYQFDAQFFNIQPMEADAIDPQQRMLLETVYDSLCDAGIPVEELRGSPTAVYVGLMCDDWSGILGRDWDSFPTYSATGMARSIISNRLSYFFDWHGPSMTIDTACSSSLVAVHQAVQTLRSGESRVAVAAGANLILSPGMYVAESKLRMLSPSGRSRMWDKDANGYARGEGLASVVMKKLSDALADDDTIECIIRETGVNQDGRTSGITMPSSIAQAKLIRDTYARAGLDVDNPNDRPQFFHAHGTGTQAGDPQEAEAISKAFFSGNVSEYDKLYVGSIKTIIGHTEGTAGLASLIGSSLALRHGTVPPNMHFNVLNPKLIPFYGHLEVPTKAEPWPMLASGQVRRVSVNSFGFGGTNAHAIIESYEAEGRKDEALGLPLFTPLPFSASSGRSLRAMMSSYSSFLTENPRTSLEDLAWTLQSRRSTFPYRAAIPGLSAQDICANIESALGENEDGQKELDTLRETYGSPRILGVFTGQGAQWPTMGRELIRSSPYVRERIGILDRSLAELDPRERPSWNIADELSADAARSQLSDAAFSQPLCTAVQIVLVDLIRAAGIKLHAVVGHSSGEIAAAYSAGLVSAQDAIRIAYYRGIHSKLAKSPKGRKGAMLAVGTSPEDAASFCDLEIFQGRIQIAAQNSSSSITLSGDDDAIDEAIEIFKDEKLFARKLKVDTAYHSSHMKPCAEPYLRSIDGCECRVQDGASPMWFSSVIRDTKMDHDMLSGQYWVENLTNPVLFSSAVTSAVTEAGPFNLVLEIGPHPALQGPCLTNIEEVSTGGRIPYSGLLSRGKNDIEQISVALGRIWTHLGSGSVDFDGFERLVSGSTVPRKMVSNLPTYDFNHQRAFWTQSRISGAYKMPKDAPNPILGSRCIESTTTHEVQWRNILRPGEVGWLKGHQLQGQTVFPATGYVVMAVEAFKALHKESEVKLIEMTDFQISRAMAFNDEKVGIETLFSMSLLHSDEQSAIADFKCYSSISSESSMAVNAQGRITLRFGVASETTLPQVPAQNFNLVDVEPERFYASLAKVGYSYSHPFREVSEVKRRLGLAVGTMEDQSGHNWEDRLLVHPAMLDTALQTIFAAYCAPGDERLWSIHVPTRMDRILINPHFCNSSSQKQLDISFRTVVTSGQSADIQADVNLFADGGKYGFIQIEGGSMVPFSPASPQDDAALFSRFDYQISGPDGDLAAMNERPSEYELKMAYDLERVCYFYLRRLTETIAPEVKSKTLLHYQRLLDWGSHIVGIVTRGEHPWIKLEYQTDTHEQIVEIIDRYRERVDIRLIEAVGENLPTVIQDNTNILEHMTKDDLFSHFYEDGLGLTAANRWIARMVWQVAHRYPHMNIMEIGAGTGGSTGYILRKLGSAFTSYTYTDVSSAFFETARERFKDYSSRMVFKTYDLEKDPDAQGFAEGSYDMIVASNVLHVTNRLEDMMTNVRRLLKPGGFLINLEVVNNDPLRNGLPMGGLPGWWIGADSGRPWGPTLTLPQWDSLLRTSGFAGIETATPQYDEVHAFCVFASQAVDDRVKLLRKPMSTLLLQRSPKWENLIIVGGKTFQVAQLVEEIAEQMSPMFTQVTRVQSIEKLTAVGVPVSSTVISVTELDEPLLKRVTAEKLGGLKIMWGQARNILWVTRGARSQEPHSYMMVGIGRAMRFEYPNINLQYLDVDKVDDACSRLIEETLLRLQVMDEWQKKGPLNDLLWSSEPEIVIQDRKAVIPRLYSNASQNARYNSSKRSLIKDVELQTSTISLADTGSGQYEIQETSPLRLPEPPNSEKIPLRITHSLLLSVQVGTASFLRLCHGILSDSGKPVVAFSDSTESTISVPADWTVESASTKDPSKILLSTAANILSQRIVNMAPENSSILIHESDEVLSAALTTTAISRKLRLVFTTCRTERQNTKSIFIHEDLPRRLVQDSIPPEVSVFLDFSAPHASHPTGRRILECLPSHCCPYELSSFLIAEPFLRPGHSSTEIGNVLKSAWSNSETSDFEIPMSTAKRVIPLREVLDAKIETPLSVVDWTAHSTVPAKIQPIDSVDIFRPDRTYLLVGLSGELGQSLCRWMVDHGARYVVLTSRNPKVSQQWIQSLEALGATIAVHSLDVTSRESLHACYDKICQTLPPVAGVANGAMVLDDVLFENMSAESLNMVLKPKVAGTKLLDELFHSQPLDFFILFSSITCVVGNSGQSNYVAASMFMTAMAFQRKSRGVAGSVMDIGSLVGIGYVEHSEKVSAEYFSDLGYRNISEQDLHLMFAEAILVGRPDSGESPEIVSGIVPAYFDAQIKAQYRNDPKFCHLMIERPGQTGFSNQKSTIPARVQLTAAKTYDEVRSILKESFALRLKQILQIDDDDGINESVSLIEQGVDSLVAVEIRSWFLKELDVDIPALRVLGGSSITELLDEACSKLQPSMIPEVASSEDGLLSSSTPAATSSAHHTPPETLASSDGGTRDIASTDNTSESTDVDEPQNTDSHASKKNVSSDSEARNLVMKTAAEVTEKLSYGQSRFWFLNRLVKDKTAFNMAISVRLTGPLRVSALEQALHTVAQKHEALRTRFFSAGDDMETPLQGVLSAPLLRLEKKTIYHEFQALQELDSMRDHVWELEDWETMRATLLSLSDTIHYLIVGCHHIAMDGISFQVFFADLEKAYMGQPLTACPVESQYRTFAAQQLNDYATGRMDADVAFYRKIIPDDPRPISLFPFSKVSSRKPLDRYSLHRADFRLDPAFTARIKRQARENKATTFHFYIAALQALLFRLLPDTEDLFIGVADANRMDKRFMSTLGFFLNLLPIRFDRTRSTKFSDAVREARNKVYAALEHSKVPFDVLLNKLNLRRSGTHTPLFQVFMDYRQGVQERSKFGDCQATGESWHIAKTGYDMSLDVIENAAGDSLLTLKLQGSLYSASSTEMLLRAYVDLLKEVTSDTKALVDAPLTWPQEDIDKALALGRGPKVDLEWPLTLSHRIEEMTKKHGHEPAIKDGRNGTLTYSQMGQRINTIGSRLLEADVAAGDTVAVFQEPTADWICSMLAIFRVGAVYVPLDLRTSIPRLAQIVEACRPRAILAHPPTVNKVPDLQAHEAVTVDISNIQESESTTLPNRADPSSPALILFTSGSTGIPKGIIISHSNLRAQTEGYSRALNIPAGAAKVLQQSAFSFDFSLDQIFAALTNGGCLVVVPAEKRGDPIEISNLMVAEEITYTSATPSEYDLWFRYAESTLEQCVSCKLAFAGGEPLSGPLVNEFRKLDLPELRLFNNYGPAETTIATTKGEVAYKDSNCEEPYPAGFMLPNFSVYVVDEKLRPLPAEVPGEIVIGGAGISSGYLQMDDLTKQKFLRHDLAESNFDFAANGWHTVYRTGDRGRLREDGALFCEGRIDGDTQVKLRGFRIELEDVETTILRTGQNVLTHAVVSVRGDSGAQFLAAHVVFSVEYPVESRESFLKRLMSTLPLPQYMCPAIFIQLDCMPLTGHLKIDRGELQKLSLPDRGGEPLANDQLTEMEVQLRSLWHQVISGQPNLGADADFFHLGGNSILLVKLQALIRGHFGVALRLVDLMTASSLHEMATTIQDQISNRHIDWASETSLSDSLRREKAKIEADPPKKKAHSNEITVVLTGATGYLGRRLLSRLVTDARVSKVYCIAVRESTTPIVNRLQLSSDKVSVHYGDFTDRSLGLSDAEFAAISHTADVIIHCGANRSFWDSYEVLRGANVGPLEALVRIALPRRVPLHFLSSGVVEKYDKMTPPTDGSDGYVATKWAAERILSNGSEELGLEVKLHRPHAVSGDDTIAESPAIFDELAGLAKQMGARPMFDGVRGHVDLVPSSEVVDQILSAALPDDKSGPPAVDRPRQIQVVRHEGRVRINLDSFSAIVEKDVELRDLEPMQALLWVGEAKKMGLSYFVAAQDIVIRGETGELVSRR